MSFETGTASSPADLVTKLFTFLKANGWTADVDYIAESQSPHYGIINRKLSPESDLNLHCGFSATTGDIFMYPMRDYVTGRPFEGVEVGTNNSSYTSTTSQMRINFPTSPFEAYWFFESDYYCHVVVEYATGNYRHFGMGRLSKIGNWKYGEYYYNHYWVQGSVSDTPLSTQHVCPFDSVGGNATNNGLLYGKQMDDQPFPALVGRQSPDSAWHRSGATDTGSGHGTDKDGRDCGSVHWTGVRQGHTFPFQSIGQNQFNSYRPMMPFVATTSWDGVVPDENIPLGSPPDVRFISLMGLAPKEEFVVGADTWQVFPLVKKQAVPTTDNLEQSLSWGMAYKKVTT